MCSSSAAGAHDELVNVPEEEQKNKMNFVVTIGLLWPTLGLGGGV